MSKVVALRSIPPKPEANRRETPPKHLEPPEAALWAELTANYRFDRASLVILGEGLTSLMRARRCRQAIERDGETIADRFGQMAAHPLIVHEKTARQSFLSAMKVLRLGAIA